MWMAPEDTYIDFWAPDVHTYMHMCTCVTFMCVCVCVDTSYIYHIYTTRNSNGWPWASNHTTKLDCKWCYSKLSGERFYSEMTWFRNEHCSGCTHAGAKAERQLKTRSLKGEMDRIIQALWNNYPWPWEAVTNMASVPGWTGYCWTDVLIGMLIAWDFRGACTQVWFWQSLLCLLLLSDTGIWALCLSNLLTLLFH